MRRERENKRTVSGKKKKMENYDKLDKQPMECVLEFVLIFFLFSVFGCHNDPVLH